MSVCIELHRRDDSPARIDVRSFCIEKHSRCSVAEIAQVQVVVFGQRTPIGDWFDVRKSESSSPDSEVRWIGDCSNVDHIGHQQRSGRTIVDGDVGNHCGSCMRGGRIDVTGSAGHHLGGTVGSRGVGMNGGLIFVRGNVGNDAGQRMRRGEILIRGDAGDRLGSLMVAGTIRCAGAVGKNLGFGIRRGTIVLDEPGETMPEGFSAPRRLATPFATVLFRHHAAAGFANVTMDTLGWSIARGHSAVAGQGEIWIQNG